MAVRNGATRSVFFGQITPEMDEAYFRKELERFGPIDQVKILGDKRVAFVHFVSINAAIKCVQTLPTEEGFKEFKINYGRVRRNACGCTRVAWWSNPGGASLSRANDAQDRCNKPPRDGVDPAQQQRPFGMPAMPPAGAAAMSVRASLRPSRAAMTRARARSSSNTCAAGRPCAGPAAAGARADVGRDGGAGPANRFPGPGRPGDHLRGAVQHHPRRCPRERPGAEPDRLATQNGKDCQTDSPRRAHCDIAVAATAFARLSKPSSARSWHSSLPRTRSATCSGPPRTRRSCATRPCASAGANQRRCPRTLRRP